MGLLDFDDKEIMRGFVPAIKSPKPRKRPDFEPDENFGALQQMGTHEQSADFADSPFADRRPVTEEEQV